MTDTLQQEIEALQALLGSPQDPEGRAFAPLADAYRRAGAFRQAVEVLRQGQERLPDFLPGHVVAAQLYLEKGLLAEAEIASRRAVELDGENELALGLLADVLDAKGSGDEGLQVRRRLSVVQGTVDEEPVMELAMLAPEPEAETVDEEPVMELAMLAPEPEAETVDEEPVMELAMLAPEPEAETAEEEPVMELAMLAPEPEAVEETTEDDPVFDVAMLAPAAASPRDEAPGEDEDADLPSDELDEEPVMTRTMAELYARQGLTDRALEVFRHLLQASPGDASLRARVEELSGVVAEDAPAPASEAPAPAREDEMDEADHHWTGGSQADGHDVDTPFAWTAEQEADEAPEAGPAISSYFGRMLAWGSDAGEEAEGERA